ncbi:MAG: glycosyltransferase family 2 protein [Chlamydiales bacterium]
MISVTLLVKNGESRLKEVLQQLQSFDEIILYDTGSTDHTLEIAKHYPNVSIHQKSFKGFGRSHNEAAELAKNSWILSIDADEVVTKALIDEIHALPFHPNHVYSIPFLNFFNGKQIKWCGWYPERHVRLYNKQQTSFSETLVHEKVITKDLNEILLDHPIHHYSYETLSDFLIKMECYSTLFAKQYQHKRKASPVTALYHGLGAFITSYLLKRGFLGGFEGFLISMYKGHTAFYKYLKLYIANQDKSCS